MLKSESAAFSRALTYPLKKRQMKHLISELNFETLTITTNDYEAHNF